MGYGNVSERRMQPPQVGVSVVILALGPGAPSSGGAGRSRLWLPLVRRVRQPYLGGWALPGGGLRADLSLERSAYLALESTTDLHPKYLEQLHTFGGPDRSRGGLPMVSVVYWALVGRAETRDFAEADNVRWFPEDDLPAMAFDHREIVGHALRRLRERIEYPDLVTRLVGPEFTLRQLHDVVEAVTGEPVDLANFRRRMLASGELEETGEKIREGRQRPAAVYRYAPAAGERGTRPWGGVMLPDDAGASGNATDAPASSTFGMSDDGAMDDALGPLTTI
ncbi:phosphohydrolase [Bifidobacterium ramosum]|uniref:Phosphohydrolase n=1 Tax=Bifidobacterium ramosum TaxID=1798158 RepID=A0A6L4X306_9BIFI|nr:phosphohydrolase [Bifidobacterium ramosum]